MLSSIPSTIYIDIDKLLKYKSNPNIPYSIPAFLNKKTNIAEILQTKLSIHNTLYNKLLKFYHFIHRVGRGSHLVVLLSTRWRRSYEHSLVSSASTNLQSGAEPEGTLHYKWSYLHSPVWVWGTSPFPLNPPPLRPRAAHNYTYNNEVKISPIKFYKLSIKITVLQSIGSIWSSPLDIWYIVYHHLSLSYLKRFGFIQRFDLIFLNTFREATHAYFQSYLFTKSEKLNDSISYIHNTYTSYMPPGRTYKYPLLSLTLTHTHTY